MSKVKICGLRRPEDVDAVNRSMPDFAGFVFAARSRRRVDEATAAMLKERLDGRIKAVGVFVNQELEMIAGLCQKGVIDWVQLHGDEDAGYIGRLRERCGGRIVKAIGIGGTLPPLPEGADYLLFDTASSQRGGIGKAFDWRVLKAYAGPPYFLAGGLSPANVGDALRSLAPFCVDVSSGVETDGFKDAEKIDAFVRLVRGH
ncbi:MAG: phosphoribosylanthranilate isomerase [Firmicutes bacterium]|nr:phosphoribosylanthranilate isomerase [Bacillota bacterium]